MIDIDYFTMQQLEELDPKILAYTIKCLHRHLQHIKTEVHKHIETEAHKAGEMVQAGELLCKILLSTLKEKKWDLSDKAIEFDLVARLEELCSKNRQNDDESLEDDVHDYQPTG